MFSIILIFFSSSLISKSRVRKFGLVKYYYLAFVCRADKEGLTPCHAIALSGKVPRKLQKEEDESCCCYHSSVNGPCLRCVDGICNLLPHSLRDSKRRRRCLEYLVQYGGDLQMYTYQKQETTKDIAERRGKTSVVDVIDEYCKNLVASF